MAVRIRLSRRGGTNESRWRVLVADQASARDGRFIEILGSYAPGKGNPQEKMTLNTERTQFWLARGAQPSELVRKYLGVLGILPPVDFTNRFKRRPKGEVAAPPATAAAPAASAPTPEVKPEVAQSEPTAVVEAAETPTEPAPQ